MSHAAAGQLPRRELQPVRDVAGRCGGARGIAGPERGAGAPAIPAIDRDALFAEFSPLISRLVRQYGDDHEARQDLVGELYWRFSSFLAAYDASRGVPLRPYLVHQLTLSAHNHARAQRRDRRRETSLEAQPDGFDWRAAIDPTPRWDHELVTDRVLSELPRAIAKLPERQRRVLISRYIELQSFEDIAEHLGVRVATTRSLLRNGLTNLRKWVLQDRIEWEPL